MTVIDDWLEERQDYQIPGSTIITHLLSKDGTQNQVKTREKYVNDKKQNIHQKAFVWECE